MAIKTARIKKAPAVETGVKARRAPRGGAAPLPATSPPQRTAAASSSPSASKPAAADKRVAPGASSSSAPPVSRPIRSVAELPTGSPIADELPPGLAEATAAAAKRTAAKTESPEASELDESAEEEAVEEADEESPTSELGRYFRDMAKLPVLRPHEEFERARRLEELEIATWEAVLGFLPTIDRAFALAEEALETTTPEFAGLRKLAAATSKLTAARKKELQAAVRRAAEQLRRLDLDKRALQIVLNELDTQANYGPASAARDRLATHLRVVRQARRRAEREKGEFVKANLRLVISVARRFAHFGQLPFADLIQEGNLGLMTAVDRFDHHRGYRFSTYATWWIRHAIARAIADRGRTVRLPVHVLDSQQRVARWKRVLTNRLGRQPTDEELSEASGIAKKKLQALTTVPAGRTVSLDAPVGSDDDDDRRLLDLVRDPEADEHAVADRLTDQAMLEEMRQQLCHLKPVEADILRQRFGLEGDEERTLKEIGEKYNLSRERIRQLQEQALGKMRKAFQGKGLA